MTVLLTIINETLKMALFAAHLNVEIILVVTVYALDIFSLFPHLLGSRSPLVQLRGQLGVKHV